MLKSLVPKLMEIKGWNATKLMIECDISWNNAFGLSHGSIPGSGTLDKLCERLDCQPNDIYVHIKERERCSSASRMI